MSTKRIMVVGRARRCFILASVLVVCPSTFAQKPDPATIVKIGNTPISYFPKIEKGDFGPFSHTATNGCGNLGTIQSPGSWDYHFFNATAGDNIHIEVHRLVDGMDPAASLFLGVTDDSNGVFATSSTNPDLTFIAFADDELSPPHASNPCGFGDPVFDVAIAVTGEYTLAVYDFLGAGPDASYEIHISGARNFKVPTVAQWGMVALVLALLTGIAIKFGAMMLRRRAL